MDLSCNSGFVRDGDTCVPLSQCGCVHNGYSYHSNQMFWADERCTEWCFCDPHTHQTQCHLDSCGPDEYCDLQDGVTSCVLLPQETCIYTGHRVFTFDNYAYDLHGTCQANFSKTVLLTAPVGLLLSVSNTHVLHCTDV
uniref:VWFD domain-containing protein n=1 Tax=Seriola lalandi dorsalis TaxID=1841481 RepID=A0A3B4XSU6_SERLL